MSYSIANRIAMLRFALRRAAIFGGASFSIAMFAGIANAQTVTEIIAAQAQDKTASAMLNESHASQIRAQADVLRATADHERGMAEADKLRHQADREGYETEVVKAETYFKKKEIREKNRRERKKAVTNGGGEPSSSPSTNHAAKATQAAQSMAREERNDYNWPRALRASDFDVERRRLETLLTARVEVPTGIGTDNCHDIQTTVVRMRDLLKERIAHYTPAEYLHTRRLLDQMFREAEYEMPRTKNNVAQK